MSARMRALKARFAMDDPTVGPMVVNCSSTIVPNSFLRCSRRAECSSEESVRRRRRKVFSRVAEMLTLSKDTLPSFILRIAIITSSFVNFSGSCSSRKDPPVNSMEKVGPGKMMRMIAVSVRTPETVTHAFPNVRKENMGRRA